MCNSSSHTDFAGYITVEPGEDEIAVLKMLGSALGHCQISQLVRHGHALLPPHGMFVLLAG